MMTALTMRYWMLRAWRAGFVAAMLRGSVTRVMVSSIDSVSVATQAGTIVFIAITTPFSFFLRLMNLV